MGAGEGAVGRGPQSTLSGTLAPDLLAPDSSRWELMVGEIVGIDPCFISLFSEPPADPSLARDAWRSGFVLARGKSGTRRLKGERQGGSLSELAWPVRARGSVYALLDIACPTPHDFTSSELIRLGRLTFHLGRGFAQARALSEAAEDHKQLAALHEITVSIGGAGGLQETLQLIAYYACQLLQARSARVDLVSADGETRVTTAIAGSSWGEVGRRRPIGEGVGGWVLRERRQLVIHNRREGVSEPPLPEMRTYLRSAGTSASLACAPLIGSDGESLGILSVAHDTPGHFGPRQLALLERLSAQAAVALGHARLLAASESARAHAAAEAGRLSTVTSTVQDALCVATREGEIILTSPSWQHCTGYRPEDLVGSSLRTLVHPVSAGVLADCLAHAAAGDEARPAELKIRCADGNFAWFEMVAGSFSDPTSAEPQFVLSLREVTERRVLEEELRYQASHDSLTNLANRTALIDAINSGLLATGPARSSAVLFLDLDLFKTVNDTLGHGAGDDLLVAVARRLERIVRPGDVVARLGGDEFAILLENTDPAGAEIVVQRLLASLKEPLVVGGERVVVSGSVGIALSNQPDDVHPDDVESLLARADLAMYEAKASGHGRYAFFTPPMLLVQQNKREVEKGLREALGGHDLFLRYQPLVSLLTGELHGLEALVRWQRGGRAGREWQPAEFLGVAESTGLIAEISQIVLQEATAQIADWRDRFAVAQSVKIAVNLSATEVGEDDLVERVLETVKRAGLPPERLVLELTETALLHEDRADLVGRFQLLTAEGIALALDDFGTGYSSLSHLREFPVAILKIDRRFVNGVASLEREGSPKAALTRGIAHLARDLGLDVVAEGLEREEDLDCVRSWGVEIGQGFIFDRPLLAEEVEARYFEAQHSLGLAAGSGS
jgi:diguanylate cyclase (GGDEF)-like protein/PAS domain S-box-containing protein